MALNGAVYNVTQYMDFHPGGWEELVKGAEVKETGAGRRLGVEDTGAW